MALLGIDLGGTKLALALITDEGKIISGETVAVGNLKGKDVGRLITERIISLFSSQKEGEEAIRSVGISVPGISHVSAGTVWAPNIPGWEDYPLLSEVQSVCGKIPVTIDSDRACYILGEAWQGNARGCRDAIFLSVGTGIGAGIMINGEILRGSHDIAGCIGWMAMQRPYSELFAGCGSFEYFASGEGIAKVAKSLLKEKINYSGDLGSGDLNSVKASDVFAAYGKGDPVAIEVLKMCIEFWGMAVANLVSLFNPEKIIMGGGVFGPGVKFLPEIMKEALKWAQPVSIHQVKLDVSALGGDAGVYGAGYLALKKIEALNTA